MSGVDSVDVVFGVALYLLFTGSVIGFVLKERAFSALPTRRAQVTYSIIWSMFWPLVLVRFLLRNILRTPQLVLYLIKATVQGVKYLAGGLSDMRQAKLPKARIYNDHT